MGNGLMFVKGWKQTVMLSLSKHLYRSSKPDRMD